MIAAMGADIDCFGLGLSFGLVAVGILRSSNP
jgi:hypothetical protein